MKRIILGIVLIVFYGLGLAGNLLSSAMSGIGTGDLELFLASMAFGLFLFVLPGILLIRSGRRALAQPAAGGTIEEIRPAEKPALVHRVRSILAAKDANALRSLASAEGGNLATILSSVLGETGDPQVRALCLDALGLVDDPEALRILLREFDRCTGFHREIAALSIANSVANRNRLAEAIPALTRIVEDRSLSSMARGQATLALCQFRSSNPEVATLLSKIKEDPEEVLELKVAAM